MTKKDTYNFSIFQNKYWHWFRPKWRLSSPSSSREKPHCRGAEVSYETRGCILMRSLFSYTYTPAIYTSRISRRHAHGEALSAWSWLTCRFIDEFGRTFVRQDFNTIEGFYHCCPHGETSSQRPPDVSMGRKLVLDALFDIIMVFSVYSLNSYFLWLKRPEFVLKILLDSWFYHL